MTYSFPSRLILHSIFVASLDATAGSVEGKCIRDNFLKIVLNVGVCVSVCFSAENPVSRAIDRRQYDLQKKNIVCAQLGYEP